MLQETYCTKEFIDTFKKGWDGEIYHSITDSSHSRGICILFKKGIKCNILSEHSDDSGRLLLINIEIDGNEYTLCNIYCPNNVNERIQFIQKLNGWIDEFAAHKRNLIIGGDFNCVDSITDRSSGNLDKSSKALIDLKSNLNLVDLWKEFNPEKIEFTYIDPSANGRNSRIDLLLSSKPLKCKMKSCCINQSPAPDHKAVCLELIIEKKVRGKGYWKMNCDVLNEESYAEGIKDLFSEAMNEYGLHVTKGVLWDYVKIKIKQYSISYCINKARLKQDRIKIIETNLDSLDDKLCNKKDSVIEEQRKYLKKELDDLYNDKAKGYQIRSRAKWLEEGEKSTSYFFGLEKSRQNYNCINSLKDDSDIVQESDEKILSTACNFYSKLYTSKANVDCEVDDFLDSVKPENVLSDTDQDLCEGKLSIEECRQAILNMKKTKSPGLDGISIEFYQQFWHLIGNFLVSVYNESYENEKLPDSQRKAVISLIFKKGDVNDIANYRPISLTNVDYRIVAFVLANRVQNVIGSIVNHDQTAYIKGRYMGTNIRLVSDVIDYYDTLDKSGLLLMIDFKKAFDSLEWNFLFKTLKLFNFGPSFIKWINTIYTLPEACIKNNGYFSESFSLQRGIRQGCPVSALMFVLCVETLGLKIRQHSGLKGFNLGNQVKQIKVVQYADDGIIFLNDKDEMCCALSILNNFGRVAGTVLNVAKCEGLWLGKNKGLQNNCKMFGIKWPNQFRCLGIYLGHDKELNAIKNWDEKIDLVDKELNKWSKRNLTLFGRIQIIKTFAMSKLVLSATLLPTPQNIIKKINKIIYKFLWRSKDKVKRIKVIKDIKNGGLGMVDTQCLFDSFKANWVNRLMKANPDLHGWAQLPRVLLRMFNDHGLNLSFNFDKSVVFEELDNINPFYKEVVMCYNRVYVTDLKTFEQSIHSQPIWGNKFITTKYRHKNKVLFLRNWIRSGINKIGDLRFVNGELDENYIHHIVIKKQNIFSDMMILKRALRPFKDLLKNDENYAELNFSIDRSNVMYKKLITNETSKVIIQSDFLQYYCEKENVCENNAFYNKIYLEKELKLREFNWKVLHGILPCNKNLKQWRKKDCDKCDVCGKVQTIEHLLFKCPYLKPLWAIIEKLFQVPISFESICCLKKEIKLKNIITFITFLIYKEWLLLSFDKKVRSKHLNIAFYKTELACKIKTYKLCKSINVNHIDDMSKLLDKL